MNRHLVVLGLGYGDEGKGSCIDHLVRKHDIQIVVRFSGGCQAAHFVVLPDGRFHRFAQMGSGTLAGARTHLSRYMMVEPISLLAEVRHLEELGVEAPLSLLTIDYDCLVTTPLHAAANRTREVARGKSAHGSCGVGIGETREYADNEDPISVRDLFNPLILESKLYDLRDHYVSRWGRALETWGSLSTYDTMKEIRNLVNLYSNFVKTVQCVESTWLSGRLHSERCLFEGSQGILLDEDWGFHPHTTWSKTTSSNAYSLLKDAGLSPSVDSYTLGIVRCYTTRHGPGPFPSESGKLTNVLGEVHNKTERWMGGFRAGNFDAVAHRYAIEVNGGVDGVAVTHLDRNRTDISVCKAYDVNGEKWESITKVLPSDFSGRERLTHSLSRATPLLDLHSANPTAPLIEHFLETPVVLESWGPTYLDKQKDMI